MNLKDKILLIVNDKNKRNNILKIAGIAAVTFILAGIGLIARNKISDGNEGSNSGPDNNRDNQPYSADWIWGLYKSPE